MQQSVQLARMQARIAAHRRSPLRRIRAAVTDAAWCRTSGGFMRRPLPCPRRNVDASLLDRARSHAHQRAMARVRHSLQNFFAAGCDTPSRCARVRSARAAVSRLAVVREARGLGGARVDDLAFCARVNVAMASVNVCNSRCRLWTTQRNFQLHPSRKSGHLCAVAFRLVRPSFELKCWNFGQTEKLEKGETK